LTVQFDPNDLASDGYGGVRYDTAANESLRPAKSRLIRASRAGSDDDGAIPVKL
jgi:hypothetical protein